MAKKEPEIDDNERLRGRFGKYLSRSDNLFAENNILRISTLLLAIAMMYLAYNSNLQYSKQQIIIQPLGSSDVFAVGSNTADDNYYTLLAQNIVDLYLDITPSNAKQKLSTLLTLFDSSVHNNYKEQFSEKIDSLERYKNVSYSAEIHSGLKIDIINNKQLVIPVLYSRIVGREVKAPKQVKLIVDFKIDYGQFKILSMSEQTYD